MHIVNALFVAWLWWREHNITLQYEGYGSFLHA